MADSLSGGELPFSNAPLRWPEGQVWWIIDWPVALLLTPLTLLFNASVSYNMAILGHVGVGAAGFVLWLRSRDVQTEHAWMAALLMTISPFVRGVVTSGVPEALSVLLVPLFLWYLERALREDRPMKSMVGAGAMAAFLVLDGAYGAVVGALAGGWCLTEALWERERHWRTVLSRSACVVVPAIGALVLLKTALSTSVHPALEQSPASLSESLPWWPLQLVGGTDLSSFFVPSFLFPEHLPAPTGHRHVVYTGLALALAAGWAARQRVSRGPVILAVLAGVMALGPTLRVWGSSFDGFTLPGVWLWDAGARNLYRLAGLASLALLMAVALAWGREEGRSRRLLHGLWLVIAVEWFGGAPIPVQLPTTPNPIGPVESWMANQPGDGAVLDLPFEHEGTAARGPHPQRSLHLQTAHGRPIASGLYPPAYGSVIPAPLAQLDGIIEKARRFEHQAARGGRGHAPVFRIPPVPAESTQQSMRLALRTAGFQFVVLDLETVPSSQQDAVLDWVTACFGPSAMDVGTRSVWEIAEP